MPHDTTIYWDEYRQHPVKIDSLPQEQQQAVAIKYNERTGVYHSDFSGTYFLLIAFFLVFSFGALYSKYKTNQSKKIPVSPDLEDNLPELTKNLNRLVYVGSALNYTDEFISDTLTNRCSFYNSLNKADKDKFIQRLKNFIAIKTFVVHDNGEFREMPILISATAIQISFGLDNFLLPNFTEFNIYPNEFLGTQPFMRLLIGNVSGHTINLSWKHFLDGFQYHIDGQNVGMHEMAHALYYQNFEIEKNADIDFRKNFAGFNFHGNKVFEVVKENPPGLYSEYAMKDFYEFWAESVEIFFEKPIQLKSIYPDLYFVMSSLLNQDPAIRASDNFS